MPEVCSLELAKRLNKLIPDTKTECYWFIHHHNSWTDEMCSIVIGRMRDGFDLAGLGEIYPAWQTHELLKELEDCDITIEKDYDYTKFVVNGTKYVLPLDIEEIDCTSYKTFEDSRLVDALAKLLIWKL